MRTSRSKEEDEDDQIEETRKKKRRTFFQKSTLFEQGEEEKWVEEVKEEKRKENVPLVNREHIAEARFDDDAGATTPNAAATADGGEKEGIVLGELIDLSRDQDTNDMEKCLNFILERGKYSYRDPVVSDVVIFNAMGGRFDHEFANISAILKAPGLLKGGPSYVCYDAYDNGAKEEEKLGIQISFPIRRGYTVLKFKVPVREIVGDLSLQRKDESVDERIEMEPRKQQERRQRKELRVLRNGPEDKLEQRDYF